MRTRSLQKSAMRPAIRGTCIAMVCTDVSEAEHVGKLISEANNGFLVTYRRVEDLVSNTPAGNVVLIILATSSTSASLSWTLRWLRHRWPRCSFAVLGDEGCGQYELAARAGGAMYLTRPVTSQQWSALLTHALGTPQKTPDAL